MIGRVIGHYEIREEIGAGGMGVVYRAWDEHLRRYVALKLLPPQSVANLVSRKRLKREALALSRLNHPSVATLHDFISEPDCDCIVMELVAGESLDQRLDRGAIPESEAVGLAIQLADGLSAAHQAGVIHRDLKPANLRITPEGRLKILDFGLAKRELLSRESLITSPTESAGTVVGTLPYIAPELWRGQAATEAADLYAFGVVFYEMVTGSRPFPDLVGTAIAHATMNTPAPSARERNPDLSLPTESVIMRCLEKSPEDRPASAKELRSALEDIQLGRLRSDSSPFLPRAHPKKRVAISIGAAVIVMVALGLLSILPGRKSEARIRSLGVLPLSNLSPDRDQDYFADGMTDELTSRLGEFPSVRVISRTSMKRYRNTAKSVPDIARELGVDYVIQGSVAVHNDRVRISVQLIDAPRDRQLWSHHYEGNPADVLVIQSRLAQSIAREIGIRLEPATANGVDRAHVDPVAYQLYLQGNFQLDRRNPDGLRRAITYFNEALDRDSAYAAAYSGLANAWSAAAFTGTNRPSEAYPKAKTAALKALALDPNLSECHTSLANILQNNDWDWESAGRAYRRAIELNDNNSVAHHWYANHLALLGHFDEATVEIQRARELDPYSMPMAIGAGAFLYFARKYEAAQQQYERAASIDSTSGLLYRAEAGNLDRLGREADAVRALCRWLATSFPGDLSKQVERTYQEAGFSAMLRLLIQGMIAKRNAGLYEPATHVGELYARLGDREEAFRWLNVALGERDTELNRLKVDPIFDPLRGDPRFDELLRQVGLAEPSPVPL